jgi:hypothetical protein
MSLCIQNYFNWKKSFKIKIIKIVVDESTEKFIFIDNGVMIAWAGIECLSMPCSPIKFLFLSFFINKKNNAINKHSYYLRIFVYIKFNNHFKNWKKIIL